MNRKAVARHRKRRKRKGLVRVEIQVPKEDADNIRALAKALRDPSTAEEARAELERLVPDQPKPTLKEVLWPCPTSIWTSRADATTGATSI